MKLFNFFKFFIVIFFVFILSSCTLKIKPPEIPYSSPVAESPIMDKNYSKPAITLQDKIAKQSKLNKINNWGELEDFLEHNLASNNFDSAVLRTQPSISKLVPSLLLNQRKVKNNLTDSAKLALDYSVTTEELKEQNRAGTLKADNQYIYYLLESSILIIKAYPALDAKIVSEIKFKNKPSKFFVTNNRLVAFGRSDFIDQDSSDKHSYSYVKIFNTENKSKPEELRHFDIEGDYLFSRLIGDDLYVINLTSSFIYAKRNSILPKVIEKGENLVCNIISTCPVPDVYYLDMPYSSYNFVSVNYVNIQSVKSKIKSQFYILPDSQNIFVSHDNLYLTYKKHLDEYQIETEAMVDLLYDGLDNASKQKIKLINLADNFVLNEYEKQVKIRTVLDRYIDSLDSFSQEDFQKKLEQNVFEKYKGLSKELEKTVIHKIKLENGKVNHQFKGEIDGCILNRFAMYEKNNNFFIFTTVNKNWEDDANNHIATNVYVLNNNLKLLGEIDDLTEGKKVDFVRFMQNRAYLNISQESNSLLTIDLNDLKNPVVLGDLKLPSPINILYPYNNKFLLGIKNDIGIKLSLFDVSQVSSPQEVGKQTFGGVDSKSIALSNRQSFIFSKDRGVIAFPVLIKNSRKGIFGTQDFDGAISLDVNSKGFSLQGLIDQKEIKRIIYINDVVYTFSDHGLQLSNFKDASVIKSISFSDK